MGFFKRKETRPTISWPLESKRVSLGSDLPLSPSSTSSENGASVSDTSSKGPFQFVFKLRQQRNRRSLSDTTSISYTTTPTDTEGESPAPSSGTSSRRTSSLFQFLPWVNAVQSADGSVGVDCGGHDDELPSPSPPPEQEALDAAAEIPVFDEGGNSRLFGSIYQGPQAIGDQQLIIFIRDFFCGTCQSFLKALSAELTLDTYFTLPIPTSVTIIGHGSPSLIAEYRELTGTPFPIYTDPSRRVYRALGMTWALGTGGQREYFGEVSATQWRGGQAKQMRREQRERRKRGGNWWWVGGEFLIREEKAVWCNRMRTKRGHSDMEVIRKLVGVEKRDKTEDCS